MKDTATQLEMRENTASNRQHASRRVTNIPRVQPVYPLPIKAQGKAMQTQPPPLRQEFGLPLTETDERTAVSTKSGSSPANGTGRTDVERPLTSEEAAAIVRVHAKTVKRMARNGALPGHFRFGRWFFYASELDCWMRTELHSPRHP